MKTLIASLLLALLALPGLLAAPLDKMTCAAYMGWYPPYATSRGSVNPCDFSILPLVYIDGEKSESEAFYIRMHRRELQLMADHGWNTIGVDGLFYDHAALTDKKRQHSINRQLQLMDYFSRAAAGMPENAIKMVPFIEFLEAYKQLGREAATAYYIDNMELMLRRFGPSPFWRKIAGRPVVMIYVANYFPIDFWREVMSALEKRGHRLFWIMELEGLDAALYGTYDHAALKPYLELFDGVYNFGCSGLLDSARFPGELRRKAAGLKAEKYVGATLWPGYLSDRPYNRNLIGHDGTGFLRGVMALTRPAKPDFLHWVYNDYKEATTLAPTFSTLSSRLEIAERYLVDFAQRPLPEAENGLPQSVLSYRKALSPGEPLMLEFLPLPARNAPASGKILLTLLDENGKKLAEHSSPDISFNTMSDYRWNNALRADRALAKIIRVRAEILLPDGKTVTYANLPDIAVVSPRTKVDQLFYNIPLHRLASTDRRVELRVNGRTGAAVPHEDLRRLDWNVLGADADAAAIAIARSGHAFRRMAAQDIGGAEDVLPGQAARNFRLYRKDRQAPYNYVVVEQAPDAADGEEYYQVLAQYPDGSWAYSPTVMVRLTLPPSELWARWVFVNGDDLKRIPDRSGSGFDLTLPELNRWPFAPLKGEVQALDLKGDLVLNPSMECIPYGPLTLEAVFAPAEVGGRRQYIAYQRGCQATLYIDKDGYAVAARLPEKRRNPNPDVTVRSLEKLVPGKWYDAVIAFDGTSLQLYLNGRLQNSSPCVGTRSSEGFFIGGVPGSRDAMIDAGGNLNFSGKLLRINISGRPWNDREVKEIYSRMKLMPFWNN